MVFSARYLACLPRSLMSWTLKISCSALRAKGELCITKLQAMTQGRSQRFAKPEWNGSVSCFLVHKSGVLQQVDMCWLSSHEFQVSCARNKSNRSKQTMIKTTCTRSFARVRAEQAEILGHEPFAWEMFKVTYKKKDRSMVDSTSKEIVVNFILNSLYCYCDIYFSIML
ncbi:uncharacterized protein LOC127811913 [Diospyros lotus]|uniref:uncharacterized protein LOC127811913 n=1 Tax=Diospyros lotus TaxID=55363 RepID=UPI00224D20E9|nr:uncharacterized protein LOC127811913 [Diospyros lotus]